MKPCLRPFEARIDFRRTIQKCPAKCFQECLLIAHDLRQSEIRDFVILLICEQYIVGFDVAMGDVALVKVFQSFQHLTCQDLAHVLRHGCAVMRVVTEISVRHEFHDDENMGLRFMILDELDDGRL